MVKIIIMAKETRNALLYAQSQEDVKYALMKAPAVSRAQVYQELLRCC